jgi:hypothetical protein
MKKIIARAAALVGSLAAVLMSGGAMYKFR